MKLLFRRIPLLFLVADRSKPELLMDVAWAASIGGAMKEDINELEALATTLPEDLAHFVSFDNMMFNKEIAKWDRDQEIQKQQQELGKPHLDCILFGSFYVVTLVRLVFS